MDEIPIVGYCRMARIPSIYSSILLVDRRIPVSCMIHWRILYIPVGEGTPLWNSMNFFATGIYWNAHQLMLWAILFHFWVILWTMMACNIQSITEYCWMYVDGGIILFGNESGLPSQNICLIATASDDCICGPECRHSHEYTHMNTHQVTLSWPNRFQGKKTSLPCYVAAHHIEKFQHLASCRCWIVQTNLFFF